MGGCLSVHFLKLKIIIIIINIFGFNTVIGCAKASSDYKWFSSDMNVVSVTAYGVVQAKKPGKATVKVVSSFDPFNYDEVMQFVSWFL